MAPNPEQVHVHHRVAAGIDGKEVKAKITIKQQHGEKRGEYWKSRNYEQVRGERSPAENRHAHVTHAGGPHLQNRGDEIDAAQERADAGDLHRPQVVVHSDARRVGQFA